MSNADAILCSQEACRFYMIESGFALTVAFLINVSIISVSGAVCNSSNTTPEDQASCKDLDLNKASFLLRVCDLTTLPQYFNCPFDPGFADNTSIFTFFISF